MNKIIQTLTQRGIIAQQTDPEGLQRRLNSSKTAIYCGFDPTADSLHLGHLMPLLCLKRFQAAGHQPVVLVGGATGLIGDPSFKATERLLQSKSTILDWSESIRLQLLPFLDFETKVNPARLINNYAWFSEMPMLNFLRDIGKHFSINSMINKEAVRERLERENQGISFTEFSYNLLQAYDFSCLYERYGVEVQIGGSDQWGNITSGIELTRRLHHATVYGLTVGLITQADGTKFGKTERGTLWLSPEKTSPYLFYQFWLNVSDSDVYRFLGYFTFLSEETIATIAAADALSSGPPSAQRHLAEAITELVHGEKALAAAQRITESLFSGNAFALLESDFLQLAQDGMPTYYMSGMGDLPAALALSQLAPSKGQARTLIESHAISVNGIRRAPHELEFTPQDKFYGRYTLLRRGKKHDVLLCWGLEAGGRQAVAH